MSILKGEAEWVIWVADAIVKGCSELQIIEELSAQGHPQPEVFLKSVSDHPLLRWGKQRSRDIDRALMWRKLCLELDRRSPSHGIARLSKLEAIPLFEIFYRSNTPFILSDWTKGWPAFDKVWSASRFMQDFGEINIDITEGREGRVDFDQNAHLLRSETTLGAFAKRIIETNSPSNDFYLIARNFALKHPRLLALLEEIDERPFLDPQKRANHVALWFGPQGTFTPLHHDTCNIMFVQCWGEKRFHMLPPYRQDLFQGAANMYSNLDLRDQPQEEQLEFTLKAGEALFIPVGWWHQVEALSHSTSLAMTHFILNNQYQWYEPGRS